MKLDSAILSALKLDPTRTAVSSHGGSGFTSTAKITCKGDDRERTWFLKTCKGKDAEAMFAGGCICLETGITTAVDQKRHAGEHASLNAIHDFVPDFCPASQAHGSLAESDGYFLVTDFLDLSGHRGGGIKGKALAAKLAQLHSIPAPLLPGETEPKFGFPTSTACGETLQPNDSKSSWADFYADNRLRAILKAAETNQGKDVELAEMVEQMASVVVPRLLGDGHLGGVKGVTPVVCHGDLWSGNHGVTSSGQAVVFDPSACYGHSEFDHGIMSMFGGFGRSFWDEYHRLVPITEPVDEYEDRVRLYEVYHHLNHYAMFGSGYKGSALRIMKLLWGKYGRH